MSVALLMYATRLTLHMHEFFNYFGASSVLRLRVRCTLKIHLGVLEREGERSVREETVGAGLLENTHTHTSTGIPASVERLAGTPSHANICNNDFTMMGLMRHINI